MDGSPWCVVGVFSHQMLSKAFIGGLLWVFINPESLLCICNVKSLYKGHYSLELARLYTYSLGYTQPSHSRSIAPQCPYLRFVHHFVTLKSCSIESSSLPLFSLKCVCAPVWWFASMCLFTPGLCVSSIQHSCESSHCDQNPHRERRSFNGLNRKSLGLLQPAFCNTFGAVYHAVTPLQWVQLKFWLRLEGDPFYWVGTL